MGKRIKNIVKVRKLKYNGSVVQNMTFTSSGGSSSPVKTAHYGTELVFGDIEGEDTFSWDRVWINDPDFHYNFNSNDIDKVSISGLNCRVELTNVKVENNSVSTNPWKMYNYGTPPVNDSAAGVVSNIITTTNSVSFSFGSFKIQGSFNVILSKSGGVSQRFIPFNWCYMQYVIRVGDSIAYVSEVMGQGSRVPYFTPTYKYKDISLEESEPNTDEEWASLKSVEIKFNDTIDGVSETLTTNSDSDIIRVDTIICFDADGFAMLPEGVFLTPT